MGTAVGVAVGVGTAVARVGVALGVDAGVAAMVGFGVGADVTSGDEVGEGGALVGVGAGVGAGVAAAVAGGEEGVATGGVGVDVDVWVEAPPHPAKAIDATSVSSVNGSRICRNLFNQFLIIIVAGVICHTAGMEIRMGCQALIFDGISHGQMPAMSESWGANLLGRA